MLRNVVRLLQKPQLRPAVSSLSHRLCHGVLEADDILGKQPKPSVPLRNAGDRPGLRSIEGKETTLSARYDTSSVAQAATDAASPLDFQNQRPEIDWHAYDRHNASLSPQQDETHDARTDGTTTQTKSKPATPSWLRVSPNLLLKTVLRDDHELRQPYIEIVASLRTRRLPIVIMQMMLRNNMIQLPQGAAPINSLLPKDEEWDKTLAALCAQGHTQEDLDFYGQILQLRSDEERCRAFLSKDKFQPLFLFNFLVRDSADLVGAGCLSDMIDYCARWYAVERPQNARGVRSIPLLSLSRFEQGETLRLLSRQCFRTEPRLLPKVAEVGTALLDSASWLFQHQPDHGYRLQSRIFNATLCLLRPSSHGRHVGRATPNVYQWAAQSILLGYSASLGRSLTTSLEGYRAIREVLASQAKDNTDKRAAARHASTWPPYLRPADGMDEVAETDESWSRAVQAGAMMQEDGFSKNEHDLALDILQGMAPDGTPTIQQRINKPPNRRIGAWEASIMATRNAHEAWDWFQHYHMKMGRSINSRKRQQLRQPGPDEYAAMFEKLLMRTIGPQETALPGDKALNHPTSQFVNLTEFEKLRLRPPTVQELYERMCEAKVQPNERCLSVLISNAPTIDTIRTYLADVFPESVVARLLSEKNWADRDPDVSLSISTAIVMAKLRLQQAAPEELGKAVRMISTRFQNLRPHEKPLATYAWGSVLKMIAKSSNRSKISVQLGLTMQVAIEAGASNSMPLPLFIRFVKTIRRLIGHDMQFLLAEVATGSTCSDVSLLGLYDGSSAADPVENSELMSARGGKSSSFLNTVVKRHSVEGFQLAARQLSLLFDKLVSIEETHRQKVAGYRIPPLERMSTRLDPVLPDHVCELLVTFAHLGDFKEMARILQWAIKEWMEEDVVDALNSIDDGPDMSNAICLFRLLAEPMLEPTEVETLQQLVESEDSPFHWPTDEMVQHYEITIPVQSTRDLTSVLRHIRKGQIATEQTAEAGTPATHSGHSAWSRVEAVMSRRRRTD